MTRSSTFVLDWGPAESYKQRTLDLYRPFEGSQHFTPILNGKNKKLTFH